MIHIEDNSCPWCREELQHPKKYSGVCEHCGLPYHSVLYQRVTRRQIEDSPSWAESSLLSWRLLHFVGLLVVLFVLFKGIDILNMKRDLLLRGVLIVLSYVAALVLTPNIYRVKDRNAAKDTGKRWIIRTEKCF